MVAPDGSFYIADNNNHRVRHVDVNGNITTYAGTETQATRRRSTRDPSGALLSRQPLPRPRRLALHQRVLSVLRGRAKVNPAGLISTVAGTGACGSTGENVPAAQAKLGEYERWS